MNLTRQQEPDYTPPKQQMDAFNLFKSLQQKAEKSLQKYTKAVNK